VPPFWSAPRIDLHFALNNADQVVMCSLCWLAASGPSGPLGRWLKHGTDRCV